MHVYIYIYIYTYIHIHIHTHTIQACTSLSETPRFPGVSQAKAREAPLPNYQSLEGTTGVPQEWGSKVTSGLIVFYLQVLTSLQTLTSPPPKDQRGAAQLDPTPSN